MAGRDTKGAGGGGRIANSGLPGGYQLVDYTHGASLLTGHQE